MGFVLFFGLGLLGAATLYWTVRHARSVPQTIFFGLLGAALLAAQCALVKFLAYFGMAFGGDDTSGVVIICGAFSIIAVVFFLVAAVNKFSNGKE
jgi:hypothetical protein